MINFKKVGGGGGGIFHSGSRQKATLNSPEHSSNTASFLGRLSSSLPVLVASLSQGTETSVHA
jgi:hypothetical protein